MKTIYSILFLVTHALHSGAQGKNIMPLQPADSRQPLVIHFNNSPSNYIRIINESGLKRLPGVIKDLSVALNESAIPERLLSDKKKLIIYLHDESCTSFKISASVEFPVNDTIYHVKLNRFNEQATDMALAATLIHEIMHCVLFEIYKGAQRSEEKAITGILGMGLKNHDTTNVFDNDFFHIMNRGNDGQHELMARLFYPQMVLLLKQFAVMHKRFFPNKKTAEFLMWTGLQNTSAYKKLDEDVRRNIVETILSEKGIDDDTE